MSTLIFDIETVGESSSTLDGVNKQTPSRPGIHGAHSDAYTADVHGGLGLSPLTGSIVAIGLYDVERKQGAVYYVGDGSEADVSEGAYILKQRSERSMLEDFWEGAKSYDTFVTFNGRAFDVPFMLHRSVVHEVMPTCDLMERRYLHQQKRVYHVDLLDQLTFYGALFRRPSLHVMCKAYGIASPNSEGECNDDVATRYQNKQFREIARYNARIVEATTLLYEKWLLYLAPESYKNRVLQF
jgi:hypothetical protein